MTKVQNVKWVRQWQVPSSKPGKTYIVSLSRSGEWSCACIAWTTTVPRKACKHIKIAKETGDQYLLWAGATEETVIRVPAQPPKAGPVSRKRAITFDD